MEMPEKWQKNNKVWVCRFDTAVYRPLFAWPNQQEGHEAVQKYFQMCEVVFKTLYMPSHDSTGKQMLAFEEEGNHLHWPTRDGNAATAGPAVIGAGKKPFPGKKKMIIPSI